jgi:PmbA protein
MVEPDEIVAWVAETASKLGADSYDAIAVKLHEGQARFSNNSMTILNELKLYDTSVYLTKGKKRILGSVSSTERDVVEKLVGRLYSSMISGASEADFAPLPSGPFNYSNLFELDRDHDQFDHAAYAQRAIDAAISAGASRVAGSLTSQHYKLHLRTSAGVEAADERTSYALNVRAFTDRDASGHSVAVATKASKLNPEDAGRMAGERASSCRSPRQVEPGKYTILFGRTVFANLIEAVGMSASAYNVEAGISFLPSKPGEEVGSRLFSLTDHGQIDGGVDSRSFDDEGVPTKTTRIIREGYLEGLLHNSTTASRFGTSTTGNAGLIQPHPWNLEVSPGDSTIEEMIRETKLGIYVTNNWYTRFQSYKTGEYSTLPRDYAFLIENGQLKYPVAGFRISDSIPRQLKAIRLMNKERSWIQWWEVRVPTLTPDALIDDVTVTRAVS